MKKIKEYLQKSGYEIFLKSSKLHLGKKSFYNDGTYRNEIYSIYKNDKKIGELIYKSTGRKLYDFRYCFNDNLLSDVHSSSQQNFIDEFSKLEVLNRK